MPNAKEVAKIVANGRDYTDWTSVEVTLTHTVAKRFFDFTCSEVGELSRIRSSMQLDAGDKVQIYLGGVKVIDGEIMDRQTAYNARSHAVTIRGESQMFDIHVSTARIPNGGELKNVTFEAAANKLLQPFGFTYRAENLSGEASRPFDRVSLQQGETVFQVLARLANMRGIWLMDDASGKTLIGTQAHQSARQSNASFIEGVNIKAANVRRTTAGLFGNTDVRGQSPAKDGPASRADSAAIAARQTNPVAQNNRYLMFQAGEPVTPQDAKILAERAVAYQLEGSLEATIVVQGWFGRDGDIYDRGTTYTVDSPMALLNGLPLMSKTVTFTQDENGGTQTTLVLANLAAYRMDATNLTGAPSSGAGSNNPDVNPNTGGEAQILTEGSGNTGSQGGSQ